MGEPTAKSSNPDHETPASALQLTEFVKKSDDGQSDTALTSGDLSKPDADGDVDGELGLKDKDVDLEQSKEEDHTPGCYAMVVDKIEDSVYGFMKAHKRKINKIFNVLIYLAFMAYFSYAMSYRFGDEGSIILLVVCIWLNLYLVGRLLDRTSLNLSLAPLVSRLFASRRGRVMKRILRYLLYVVAGAGLLVYLSIDVFQAHAQNLQSFVGLLCLVILTFIFSSKPSRVNWHLVFWGFIIQFVFAILTLRTEAGYSTFKWVGDLVSDFIALSDKGTKFVIGDIPGGGLLFQVGGVAVFFNSFIFLMNHYGVIEAVVKRLGGLISLVLETGPVESVIAAANIFIGLVR
ncbi:solute carrier family 28 member 3 [Aplysia californica]|uniref:Solute carrier family 28 member 3 n=1 Tax=Aplysia californica TaxID=6500 RepID=A0ABM0ZZ65_APLCA|nr:solute carrier family 28 member 3 [Aplysia californica]